MIKETFFTFEWHLLLDGLQRKYGWFSTMFLLSYPWRLVLVESRKVVRPSTLHGSSHTAVRDSPHPTIKEWLPSGKYYSPTRTCRHFWIFVSFVFYSGVPYCKSNPKSLFSLHFSSLVSFPSLESLFYFIDIETWSDLPHRSVWMYSFFNFINRFRIAF